MKKQKVLLLEDVYNLGKSGEIVSVKSGYARNYLLPKKIALYAQKNSIKIQEKLIAERAKKAALDKKDSEFLADKLKDLIITQIVKVDKENRMYGSVSSLDVFKLLEKEGYVIDKHWIDMKKPIKALGVHTIDLNLKEGVPASLTLKVIAENIVEKEELEKVKESDTQEEKPKKKEKEDK
jgi:large subunit ribosomal protein L9